MKTFQRLTFIATACVALSTQANAQNYQSAYDVARVISAQPIYQSVEVDDGREVCRNERVREVVPTYTQSYRGSYRPRSESASVLGAIVGGVIGNQFGHGRGRAAATVAGAALGAAAVNDSQRYDRYGSSYAGSRTVERVERVCEYRPQVRYEREVVGYTVRYDYKGQIGETTTRNRPGNTIRVAVDVTAIED